MYGYVALHWKAADDVGARAASVIEQRIGSAHESWELVFSDAGLRVFQRGANRGTHGSIGLADSGTVLGTIFRNRSGAQTARKTPAFSETEMRDIKYTNGKYLVEHYWGRYVAFSRGTDSCLRVTRDPTGALPCFYTQADHVTVFFSHLEDYLGLVPTQLTVNWEHVGDCLQYMQMASRQTGLREISQVLAGECWTQEAFRSKPAFLWDPASIGAGTAIEDPAVARVELRCAVEFCVDAWASCYPSILHSLSGGLDSSIVLACLSSSPTRPQVTCFTAYTAESDGDERQFARMAASRANCQLAEFAHQPPTDLSGVFPEQRFPSPAMVSLQLAVGEMEKSLAHAKNSGAIFSGQGGDHDREDQSADGPGRRQLRACERQHRHCQPNRSRRYARRCFAPGRRSDVRGEAERQVAGTLCPMPGRSGVGFRGHARRSLKMTAADSQLKTRKTPPSPRDAKGRGRSAIAEEIANQREHLGFDGVRTDFVEWHVTDAVATTQAGSVTFKVDALSVGIRDDG
jgi:hypothetical protein